MLLEEIARDIKHTAYLTESQSLAKKFMNQFKKPQDKTLYKMKTRKELTETVLYLSGLVRQFRSLTSLLL